VMTPTDTLRETGVPLLAENMVVPINPLPLRVNRTGLASKLETYKLNMRALNAKRDLERETTPCVSL